MTEPYFLTLPSVILQAAGVSSNRDLKDKPFTPESFYNWLIAEHSPIRRVILTWMLEKVPYWLSVHFARHVHSLHFVQSNREDRTGVERSPNDTADHLIDSNCQALIDMARKRLCFKSHALTRGQMLALKFRLSQHHDPYARSLGHALVPNCIYRAGCPEDALGRGCGYWKTFCAQTPAAAKLDITSRYAQYNARFKYKED